MAYNTIDDILGEISQDTLIQLTDDNNLGVVDEATVDKILERSSAQVDGYCSNLYDVPFDTPTAFLKATDLDIVIYNLFSRRENVPENRISRFKNAVKVLEGVAKGDIQLGAAAGNKPVNSQIIAISSQPENIFTRDRLKNF